MILVCACLMRRPCVSVAFNLIGFVLCHFSFFFRLALSLAYHHPIFIHHDLTLMFVVETYDVHEKEYLQSHGLRF
jgi:hypothetical protein